MATLPNDPRQLVTFAASHKAAWTTNQAVIGITTAQLTAFSTALTNASKSATDADVARDAAVAATATFHNDARTLRDLAGAIVRSVQTFAKNTNNPAVYTLAMIPAPQARSQNAPPPARPTNLSAVLNSTGDLTITWRASNPSGVSNVVYQVQRAIGDAPDFTLLDTVGEKKFIDKAIPAGTAMVSYLVTGKRGGQSSEASEVFTARFGHAGNGQMVLAGTFSTPSTARRTEAA